MSKSVPNWVVKGLKETFKVARIVTPKNIIKSKKSDILKARQGLKHVDDYLRFFDGDRKELKKICNTYNLIVLFLSRNTAIVIDKIWGPIVLIDIILMIIAIIGLSCL